MKKETAGTIGFDRIAIIAVGIMVLYAATIGTLNFFTASKVGYVNSGDLMEKYPRAISAREALNTQLEEWRKNIVTLEEELTALNQEMVAKAANWQADELENKKAIIQQKQEDYLRYSRAIQEKATKLEQELMQPIYNEINVFMADFGQENGYEMIFGTLAGGNILYAQEAVDLTEEFLGYAATRL